MDAQTDSAGDPISTQWDRIRREERLDQERHLAEDVERDARIAAELGNLQQSTVKSHRAR